MKFSIVSSNQPAEVVQHLEDRLHEHNIEVTGYNGGEVFAHVAHDENSRIAGGVAGWVWGGIAEVTQLWVDKACRGNAIGSQLLQAAEQHIAASGGRTVMLRTFSFQAPRFYESKGYTTVSTLEHFPEGHNYYCMLKHLD